MDFTGNYVFVFMIPISIFQALVVALALVGVAFATDPVFLTQQGTVLRAIPVTQVSWRNFVNKTVTLQLDSNSKIATY